MTPSRVSPRIVAIQFDGLRTRHQTIEEGRADEALVAKLGGQIAASLPLFEALLGRRDFLLGETLGVADLVCFPFLKYATVWEEGDEHLFHELLRDHQRLDGRYPRLEAWIARLNALPRA